MAASTLGEITVMPAVDWEGFAKEWIALGGDDTKIETGEVDDLADAFGNWGKASNAREEDGLMMD